jgi:hypothetical protein
LKLKSELAEAKSSLQLYKTIELAVKGSMEELTAKLHEIGDYSQVSKLSFLILNK